MTLELSNLVCSGENEESRHEEVRIINMIIIKKNLKKKGGGFCCEIEISLIFNYEKGRFNLLNLHYV